MNLNELFLFKTMPCNKKEKHDLDICYFFHQGNNDTRRPIVDLTQFLLKFKENNETDEIINKALIKFYSEEIGYENELLNNMLFKCPPCKTTLEHKYHINNYKIKECFFENSNLHCPYGNVCFGTHKKEEKIENIEVMKLCLFIQKLKDISKTISKSEVYEIHDLIYSLRNNFLDPKNFLLDSLKSKNKNSKEELIKFSNNPNNNLNHLEITNIIFDNSFKKNIHKELKNIATFSKGDLFYNAINVDNYIVYLSNTLPKKDDINKLIIAFLNSHNGILIYGVDINTEKLNGIKMKRNARDQFKKLFNGEYKDILVEYNDCIKYKFYDLEDFDHAINLCIIVIKIKKIKDNKFIFDPFNKAYIIKEKFINQYKLNKKEKIRIEDIKQLNMKEFVNLAKHKFEKYYKNKYLK